MSIPLVQNNEKDSINTSIIAIKRNIERINMLLGLSNSEEIDTSEFVKKSDIVDEVTVGNMQSVTSNAVAESLSYSITEQKTGGMWLDGKPIYRKVFKYSNRTIETSGGVLLQANAKTSTEKIIKIKALYVSTNEQFRFNDFAYFNNNDLYTLNHLTGGTYNVTVTLEYTKTTD